MKPKKDLQRTVSFWQLVRAVDREPLEQIDWPSVLSGLTAQGPTIRHSVESVELSGTVYPLNEVDHLVLTKDRDDLPRQQHTVTGQVADMSTTGTEWVVIESAFVSFLEFGNVFGYLQSASTAPSPQAVAKWINKTKVLDTELQAEPVVDPDRWKNLKHAGGVSRLEVAASARVLTGPEDSPLKHLFSLGKMGDVNVEVKITASCARKPGDEQERRKLHRMTEAVIAEIGLGRVDKAKAKIFDEDNLGIPSDTINLIKHRFTTKRPVVLCGDGRVRSVSELSAFGAILSGLGEFEDDLRKAVGAEQAQR